VALLTVKPSRGTVVFFGLLVAGLLIRYGWGRHEEALAVRDSPPAHDARRLLRCTLGRAADRSLGARPGGDDRGQTWARTIAARLQRIVSSPGAEAQLGRCAPLAARLAPRLLGRAETQRAGQLALSAARTLQLAGADRLAAIESIERGDLPYQLAGLAYEISGLSDGALAGWTSPLPPESTDLWPIPAVGPPHGAVIGGNVEYATFAMPDLVLYQSVADRRLHAVTFDAAERVRSDRAIGPGAPVRGAWRDGAVLVASDEGDAVFLPGGEPAQLVPLPDAVRRGAERADDWQVAFTPAALWLLTNDDGALRVRTTPRAGAVRWSDPVATIGATDAMAGAVLAPEPGGQEAVRVTALRRGAQGIWLEQYVVTASGGAPVGTSARAGASTAAPTAPAAAGSPSATATAAPTEAPGATYALSGPTVIAREWPAYAPQVTTCSAGATRYVVLVSGSGISVVHVAGDRASRQDAPFAAVGVPAGGRFEVQCSDRGVLLDADMVGRPNTLVYFDNEASEAAVLLPPHFAPGTHVLGGALTANGTVVALVAGMSARTYYTTDRGLHWAGGDLVSLPSENAVLDVSAMAAQDNQVAVLSEVLEVGQRLVSRLGTRDPSRALHGD
jgi:hypothetical protein